MMESRGPIGPSESRLIFVKRVERGVVNQAGRPNTDLYQARKTKAGIFALPVGAARLLSSHNRSNPSIERCEFNWQPHLGSSQSSRWREVWRFEPVAVGPREATVRLRARQVLGPVKRDHLFMIRRLSPTARATLLFWCVAYCAADPDFPRCTKPPWMRRAEVLLLA